MSGQDPEGYVQGCQLSIPGRGPRVVKSLPRQQTLRELGTLQPATHLLATASQPVEAHLTGESSFRRMFTSCVFTDQGWILLQETLEGEVFQMFQVVQCSTWVPLVLYQDGH